MASTEIGQPEVASQSDHRLCNTGTLQLNALNSTENEILKKKKKSANASYRTSTESSSCWSHGMRKIEKAGTSPRLSDFMERT